MKSLIVWSSWIPTLTTERMRPVTEMRVGIPRFLVHSVVRWLESHTNLPWWLGYPLRWFGGIAQYRDAGLAEWTRKQDTSIAQARLRDKLNKE